MKIDHIAIWVNDLELMKEFFIEMFQVICSDLYENSNKGFSSYFLSFEQGARIEIMHRSDILDQNGKKGFTKGITHFAISVGTKKKVDQLTETCRLKGHQILGEPRITGDGYYESVISDPEGNHIEIVA